MTLLTTHKVFGDERGKLVSLEAGIDVPFEIKRVFYIYGTSSDRPRGHHAHYKTKQYLVAVSGSCKVTLDNGRTKELFELSGPSVGLSQDEMVWGTMHDFSPDCVLMVLANEKYDILDYIHSYDDFQRIAQT
jgi:hypothetical protein